MRLLVVTVTPTTSALCTGTRWRRRDYRRHSNPSLVLERADEGNCASYPVTGTAYVT